MLPRFRSRSSVHRNNAIRTNPLHQNRTDERLTATTDTDAWLASEGERIGGLGLNAPADQFLRGQLQHAVDMRDWLQSLPDDQAGLIEHFEDMSRESSLSGYQRQNPAEAVEFVNELRRNVEDNGGDHFHVWREQAPETREINTRYSSESRP